MKVIQKTSVLLLVAILTGLSFNLWAQTKVIQPLPRTSIIPIFTNNPYALYVITNLLAEPKPELSVPDVATTARQRPGTFWTLSTPAPLPLNPFPNLPVYEVSTNHDFIIDDRSVDYEALAFLQEAEAQMLGLTNETINPYTFNTNGLWLQVSTNSLATPEYFSVNVMNTLQGQGYDILTKADLQVPAWATELVVTGAVGQVTPVQVPKNSRAHLFVRAQTSVAYSFYLITPPLSQTVVVGDTVTFRVETGGNPNLTFQWTFNGVPIAGATNQSYTILSVLATDAGDYSVNISDGTQVMTTAAATLTTDASSDLCPLQTGEINLIPILSQRQDYTFKSGVTYYVASVVQLHGHTTIEGGAVIKPDWHGNAGLEVRGTLTCQGEPYFPAVFTSVDDDSVGVALGFSEVDGPPQPNETGVPYLDLTYAQSNVISHLQIKYADWGVTTPVLSRQLNVWNCQFVECNYGLVNLVAGSSTNRLHNVLFAACGAAVGAATNAITIEAEHVTADAGDFCLAASTPSRMALTNSLVWGNTPTAASLVMVSTALNPGLTNFSSTGAGNYYLAANSPLHQAGTAGISLRLQMELQGKTTYPPMAIAPYTTLAGEMTLAPQALRYTNGAPDLGYHYDVLDYTVGMLVLNGGTVTVLPGTAIGLRNEYVPAVNRYNWWGFWLEQGSAFISHGTPEKTVVFTDVQLVQEQPAYPCNAAFVPGYLPLDTTTPAPGLDFQFCRFFAAHGGYHVWAGYNETASYASSPSSLVNWTMRDCALRGGLINLGQPDDGQYFGASPDYVYGPGSVTWWNNSFDGVSINLDPTYYANNQVVNCDMQVHACNNLFRGGQWLHLEPVPATAGNWVFEDNLFDRVNLVQNTNAPVDYDHNGYAPLTAQELAMAWNFYPWYVANYPQLQPATGGSLTGSSDLLLTTALPYQAGPLGSYYLPDTTPLYGAGSRPAGEAGLAQYTTSTSQTKEGATHTVNIGVHYVAATSTHPTDSDGDGVPDYREDANGNGLVDGMETDLTLAVTDGITPDALNVAYNDVDLSGNGSVGRIKKALGLNPLDPNNPLTLKQVITGEEPDLATFDVPIQFSLVDYDSTNAAGKLNLLMDGQPVSAYYGANSNGLCRFEWDTRFDPPGYHNLQVKFRLNYALAAGLEPDPTVVYAHGGLTAHTSQNELQFDPFYCEYNAANGAMIYAKLTDPAASFTVELQTTNGTHVKWLAVNQTSPTGEIELPWDLTDDNGQAYTGDAVNAGFTLNQSGKTNWLPHFLSLSLPDDGDFTIAYACNSGGDNQDLRRCIQWSVVDQLIGICNATFCFDHFYESTFNSWSDLGQITGNPGHLATQADANALLTNLANVAITSPTRLPTKNFYFFGHGKGSTLGTMNDDANVQRSDVAQALGNLNFTSGKNKGKICTGQKYRFVFLDACSTADDESWANAFGIRKTITEENLQIRPGSVQAFVGWQHLKRVPGVLSSWMDMSDCQSLFWSAWQNGLPLDRCIYFASKNHPPAPFDFLDLTDYNLGDFQHWNSWEISKWGFGWNDPKITIYGYAGITRTGFAPGYDNSNYYKK